MAEAADAPGYPIAAGQPAVREAVSGWLGRRIGVDPTGWGIIPSIGSKEMVALLPTLLGLRAGDTVVIPELAYPTYAVGAAFAGCDVRVSDDPDAADGAALVWLNSPSNPTGAVADTGRLRDAVAAARMHGALIASDECYIEFGWEAEPRSCLHPAVVGDDPTGVVALHALSKRSNMAGYRYGTLVGDPEVVDRVLQVRRHLGLLVPDPVQSAAAAAWADDAHVDEQRARYSRRRDVLRPALESAGFVIDHSEAGLYLWATRDEPCWDTVADLASRAILVAPGDFYGAAGARHVRIALTASDADIAVAAERVVQ